MEPSLLGVGVGLFSLVVAAALSSITIAVAWFFVRPLLGIALLVLAVGGVVWLLKANKKKQQAVQGSAVKAA